jgi:hypothetical protein
MTPVPIAAVTGAILHYKFLADFHAHAQVEAGRGEHFANGREYKEYLLPIRLAPTPTMGRFVA